MKKFKLTLFSLLAFILGLFCLASWGEGKFFCGKQILCGYIQVSGAADGGRGGW